LTESRISVFDWCQNQRPLMTLNGRYCTSIVSSCSPLMLLRILGQDCLIVASRGVLATARRAAMHGRCTKPAISDFDMIGYPSSDRLGECQDLTGARNGRCEIPKLYSLFGPYYEMGSRITAIVGLRTSVQPHRLTLLSCR